MHHGRRVFTVSLTFAEIEALRFLSNTRLNAGSGQLERHERGRRALRKLVRVTGNEPVDHAGMIYRGAEI